MRRSLDAVMVGAAWLLGCGSGEITSERGEAPRHAFALVHDGRARVSLPISARGAFEVADPASEVRVAVELLGAAEATAEVVDGTVVYRGALGDGTSWTHVPGPTGTEDYVTIGERRSAEIAYALSLSPAIAGLRNVAGVLEMLDASGTPRLRMTAPRLLASDGTSHPLQIRVEGCAVDVSPVVPWGRPVTPPGAASCVVRVTWSDAVAYPIVVDPAWTATDTLSVGKRFHAITRLADGKVICTGGETPGQSLGKRTEVWDPATGTWTITGDQVYFRIYFGLVTLDSGKVLAMGGSGIANDKSELYDPATGVWTVGPLIGQDWNGSENPVKLASGKVLISGGSPGDKASARIYDPSAGPIGAWGPTGSMATARSNHRLTRLANGSVLATGGYMSGPVELASAELYSPTTGTWAPVPSMTDARQAHAAIRLGDGRVLVAGGIGPSSTTLKTAEVYDPIANSWSPAGMLAAARYNPASALLPSGRVLVIAGAEVGALGLDTTEIYDPLTNGWSSGGKVQFPRSDVYAGATALLDGRVVAAGGAYGGGALIETDIFTELGNGQPCTLPAECGSKQCVDGVCCENACTGACKACSATKKGGGSDGTCGSIAAGTDPDADCKDDGSPGCDDDGLCDGAGACEKYPVSSGCAPTPCALGSDCTSGVCADGICCDGACTGTCQACTAALKQSGPDGLCGPTKADTDPHDDCTDDGSPTCQQDGSCDGAGACQLYAVQAGCAAEPCASGADCTSGFCVDGVCCDSACTGACVACTAAKKGSGVDGTCEAVAADTDPDSDCSPDPGFPGSCKADGQCDGSGQCRPFAKLGVACGVTTCLGNTVSGFICNGGGECIQSSATCDPYLCQGTACTSTCQTPNDCVSTAYCTGTMACADKLITSSPCSSGVECETGFCVDGYCCNTTCTGQCEACNVDPNPGICTPVTGIPHGAKTPCAGEGPCLGACNGVDPGSCVYPGSTTSCGTTCSAGEQKDSVCDGAGTCEENATKACTPYVCDAGGTKCVQSCTTDDACDTGYACGADGKCVPKAVATCDGDHSLTLPDGTVSDCSPYRCDGTACKTSCTSVDDCAQPAICDETHKCVARPSGADGDEGGCGCRIPGSRGEAPPPALYALALAALLGAARRRRDRA